jgi:hypothetical protein
MGKATMGVRRRGLLTDCLPINRLFFVFAENFQGNITGLLGFRIDKTTGSATLGYTTLGDKRLPVP